MEDFEDAYELITESAPRLDGRTYEPVTDRDQGRGPVVIEAGRALAVRAAV